jgi:hypothetical protein
LFFSFFLFFFFLLIVCLQLSKALKTLPAEVALRLCESSVAEISKRLVSFEEPVSVIRELWADLLEADEAFEEAARVLEGIVLDSPHRQVKLHYKVCCWLLKR